MKSSANTQKQHVEIHRKFRLRRDLLKHAVDGAAYVPFIGDGDIAVECYADRKIYGADIDPDRVRTAQGRLPSAEIKEADCDQWPFVGVNESFAVADLDAYSNPYKSLVAFWESAMKGDTVVIFGTDGLRQRTKRSGVLKELPSGNEVKATLAAMRQAFNKWWIAHVRPFIAVTVEPYKIIKESSYLRKDMLYWGVVVSKNIQVEIKSPSNRLVKFGTDKKAKYVELLRNGGRRYQSAKEVGVSYETIRLHLHSDAEFARAVDVAEGQANEHVEDALFQAAKSGNVVACQVWLYNRAPDRWKDQRNLNVAGKYELTGKDGAPLFDSDIQNRLLQDPEAVKLTRLLRERMASATHAGDIRNGSKPRPLANGTASKSA